MNDLRFAFNYSVKALIIVDYIEQILVITVKEELEDKVGEYQTKNYFGFAYGQCKQIEIFEAS